MLRTPRIHIAMLICAAFIFRILFINIGPLTSLNTIQHKHFLKSHRSTSLKKRRRYFDTAVNLKKTSNSIVEICKAEDNQKQAVTSTSFLTRLFSVSVTGLLKSKPFLSALNYFPSYHTRHRYLALQVFRI